MQIFNAEHHNSVYSLLIDMITAIGSMEGARGAMLPLDDEKFGCFHDKMNLTPLFVEQINQLPKTNLEKQKKQVINCCQNVFLHFFDYHLPPYVRVLHTPLKPDACYCYTPTFKYPQK